MPCGGHLAVEPKLRFLGKIGRICGISNGAHEQYNLKFEISNLKFFLVQLPQQNFFSTILAIGNW